MSRLGAALGAVIGGSLGSVGLGYLRLASGSNRLGIAQDDAELYGALGGAVIGAAIGAGSSEPTVKVVGTAGAPGVLADSSLALNGVSVGFGADPVVATFKAGDMWEIDFESDRPVTPDQFFALMHDWQRIRGIFGEGVSFKTVSFAAVDQTHFRTTVQWLMPGNFKGSGHSEMIDGVNFTVTGARQVPSTTASISTPVSSEEKRLSTGAIVGLSAAGMAVAGTIVYAATRPAKKGRR